jgi:hypothetical protein
MPKLWVLAKISVLVSHESSLPIMSQMFITFLLNLSI